ncbi:MAG: response regulator [Mariprofundaceae bacterium]
MTAGNVTKTTDLTGDQRIGEVETCESFVDNSITSQPRQIDAELLDFVYSQTPKILTGTLIAAWILTLILWPAVSHTQLLAWAAALLLLTVGRFALMKNYQAAPLEARDLPVWRGCFITGAGMGGLLWGLGGVVFAQQSEIIYQLFIIFMLGGISVGAASILPAVFPAFIATCLGSLSPILLWLLQHGDRMHVALGTSVVLFIGIIWMIARQMHESLLDAFTLRHDNSGLVEKTRLANRELKGEISQRKLTQDALDKVVTGTAAAIGQDFFHTLVQSLAEALGIKYAFVGKLNGGSNATVTTLAVWTDGKLSENFVYDLAGTPCENVMGRKVCSYSESVQQGFPEDELLVEMGVESYVGAPLFDGDGNSMGLLAVMDTKALRQVELARSILGLFAARAEAEMIRLRIEAERSRLAMAVKQASDSIFIADEDGTIAYVNSAFEHITGHAGRDIVGKQASILRSPRQGESFYHDMRETLLEQRAWAGRHFLCRKDGADIIVERNITYIKDGPNAPPSFISIFRDVTREENLRQQMEHTQRLESLGVLAGGIAHDFNNILTAILGNASLATTKLDATSPVKKHLGRIEDGAKRAADLCRQMLAYSGKGQFITQPIHLFTQVSEMSKLLEVSIAKNITIHYQLENDRYMFKADASQIQQVIMNLIINASEAIGEDHGAITITSGTTGTKGGLLNDRNFGEPLLAGRYAFLEVSDTGCGMDQETQSRIFEPFFTTKFTGRGLGMSAVLGIVRSNKGSLFIKSEPGKGSSFKVLFPCIKGKAAPANILSTKTECDNWHGSGTVLVIDDEESIRDAAGMMLGEMGFKVVAACDGKAGVEVFSRHRKEIVAILLDMTMPRMNGRECLTQIKSMDADAKIILSTGYDEQDATGQFSKQKLCGFVQKPYSPSQLRNTLMKVLN